MSCSSNELQLGILYNKIYLKFLNRLPVQLPATRWVPFLRVTGRICKESRTNTEKPLDLQDVWEELATDWL